MAAKAKKEGKFGLSHIFATAVVAMATTMVVGPMIEYNWTHFSEVGQALSQIGNALFMPVFNSIAPAVMPFLDPIREGLGITATFAEQTAQGVNIVSDAANAVTAGTSSILGGQVPSLGGNSIPLLGDDVPILK